MDNLFFQHCNIFQVWILIKYIRFFAINKSNIFYLYIDVFLYSTNIFLNKKALFPNTKTLSGTMTTVTDLINAILGQQVTLELKQSITKTFCFLPEFFSEPDNQWKQFIRIKDNETNISLESLLCRVICLWDKRPSILCWRSFGVI